MDRKALMRALEVLDEAGIFVFNVKTLHRCFLTESLQTFKSSLSRQTKEGLLEHPCRGIYINRFAKSRDAYVLEHIAKTLRWGEYNYLSLESLLSEQGVISQVPLSLLTVMTTGRSQTYQTSYGNIEFTHTKKKGSDILEGTYKQANRPLRLAKKKTAILDLKRVNRNTHLLDLEES